MTALSTFIKIYIISFVVFLIPPANSISNKDSKEIIVSPSHIEIEVEPKKNNKIAKVCVVKKDHEIKKQTELPITIKAMVETIVETMVATQKAEIETTSVNSKEPVKPKVTTVKIEPEETDVLIEPTKKSVQIKPDYWTTLYSIESKQGRLLYRPSNKKRNCKTTSAPCGHHQLSLHALKDISCTTKQCMDDRGDYEKSLAMSKKLLAINEKRLNRAGLKNLPEYQKYLVHQQGASGLKIILAASQGKKLLSRNLKKNMAGNSSYSYKKLKSFGSKLAAKKFLQYWKKKWENEKDLVIAANTKVKPVKAITKSQPELNLPLFNEHELQIALNIKM